MQNLKIFLNHFLDEINYSGNREGFIEKLLSVMYMETIEELIRTLPQDRQVLLTQTLESAKTPELLQQAIETHFDKTVFDANFKKIAPQIFTEYLQIIEPSLTLDQEERLGKFFASQH